jgi:hypothetical protein
MADALRTIKPQVDGMLHPDAQFWICVDQQVQMRAFLAGMVAAEGGYGVEWCRRAVEEGRGDLSRMRSWLEINAPRKGE